MRTISRRNFLAAAAFSAILGPAGIVRARVSRYGLESGNRDIRSYHAYHEGLGSIDVKVFDFGGAPAPANFLIYDIPPGASEGVHTHNLTDPKLGAFDEYYYIIEGRGTMSIDGESVMVVEGDHIHTPLDVAHGIENSGSERLKVFLTYIDRSAKGQDLSWITPARGP